VPPCAGSFAQPAPSCSYCRSTLPDLNPIEQVFAKLKHLLRKAAARTVETVCIAIGKLLDSFTPAECANHFKNSGYASI
jgi:transposase